MKKICLILLLLVGTISTTDAEDNEYEVCPYGLCFGHDCGNA